MRLGRVGRHQVGDLDFNIWEKHYPTLGPGNRYGAILFIEKEGFMPLFQEVKLAERYDIAIMSTKGMSVTASRQLVDRLCGEHGIPLLVLHDFDKAGFSIAGTLKRNTRRYSFQHKIKVIDLGLRIEDIDGLETEEVYIESPYKARENLKKNGASNAEIDFLLDHRVELNAFASDAMVEWIEGKLKEHGVSKVVPDNECLSEAYRRAYAQAVAQARIDEALEEIGERGEAASFPDNLKARVERRLREKPEMPWDTVVREIAAVQQAAKEEDGE